MLQIQISSINIHGIATVPTVCHALCGCQEEEWQDSDTALRKHIVRGEEYIKIMTLRRNTCRCRNAHEVWKQQSSAAGAARRVSIVPRAEGLLVRSPGREHTEGGQSVFLPHILFLSLSLPLPERVLRWGWKTTTQQGVTMCGGHNEMRKIWPMSEVKIFKLHMHHVFTPHFNRLL